MSTELNPFCPVCHRRSVQVSIIHRSPGQEAQAFRLGRNAHKWVAYDLGEYTALCTHNACQYQAETCDREQDAIGEHNANVSRLVRLLELSHERGRIFPNDDFSEWLQSKGISAVQ
jgi:hypothetical protein